MDRRQFLGASAALALIAGTGTALADSRENVCAQIVATWYRLTLELVRHTPTYTPPVASRALAYIGIGAYEALASGMPDRYASLAGQLTGLAALPRRASGQDHDNAVVLNAVFDVLIHDLFANTGPTGQHAMKTLSEHLAAQAATDVSDPVAAASKSYGTELATAILDWSRADGGAVVEYDAAAIDRPMDTANGGLGHPIERRQHPHQRHGVSNVLFSCESARFAHRTDVGTRGEGFLVAGDHHYMH